jgi:hypothetical protein
VKREAGLGSVEVGLEVAHASFAISKHLENADPRFIGQRVKELGGAGGICGGFHDWNHIN